MARPCYRRVAGSGADCAGLGDASALAMCGKTELRSYVCGRNACFAQGLQCHGEIALGKFPARFIHDQPMMCVSGNWQTQQRLQNALHMGSVKQIMPACHQIDALQRIVCHHGNVITGGHVLARQHHVTQSRGLHALFAALPIRPRAKLVKHKRMANTRNSLCDVEAQCIWRTGRDSFRTLIG